MATRRSTRVTQVNPWIPGGEGQLRDLFPLPPALFITFKGIGWLLRHYLFTALLSLSLYLWIKEDWWWFHAFVTLPLLFLATRIFLITAYLWYKNPSIPLLARRQ